MILEYFSDPILRAPTMGCILMCVASSLMGAIAFLTRKSLLGESISHGAYPGIVLGTLLGLGSEWMAMVFALLSSMICLKAIGMMEKKGVRSDAALCFALSSFFGIGILLMSYLQHSAPVLAKKMQLYLYGQAATMTDGHVFVYGALALGVVGFVTLAYRPLQAILFDPLFSKSAKIGGASLEKFIFFLFLLAIVLGVRSAGVVLVSGMLIAPVSAARQFTDRLSSLLGLSACFGAFSALLGNVLALEWRLPTGPAIVLIGAALAVLSLLFAPKRGALFRAARILRFRMRCVEENILKTIWRKGTLSFVRLRKSQHVPKAALLLILLRMKREGYLTGNAKGYDLSKDGFAKATRIVRLHRLWEVYLTDLGWPHDKVHASAEEMEHILTKDLEERLSKLLSDRKFDPHQQPIPERV